MAVKAVIFDLFGTLTHGTSPENRTIEKFNLDPEIHTELVRAVCGQKFQEWKPYLNKVVEAAGIEKSEENKAIVKQFIDLELEKGANNVFKESKQVLQGLKEKGFVLGLVSDCYPVCRKILEKNGLAGFFEEGAIFLSYEQGTLKWEHKIYRFCLEKLGIPAEQAVMVGDNPKTDILSSREATDGKIKGILISKNPGPEEKALGCSIVSSIAEVPKAIGDL